MGINGYFSLLSDANDLSVRCPSDDATDGVQSADGRAAGSEYDATRTAGYAARQGLLLGEGGGRDQRREEKERRSGD